MKFGLQKGSKMAELNHDFLVINTGSYSLDKYQEYQSSDRVEIHDDLLHYFGDTLLWISAFNPSLKKKCRGLCWYGVTMITIEGIDKTKSIFNGWLRLLSEGPDILTLHGEFSWNEGKSPQTGSYNKLSFNQSEIIRELEKLISYCDIVRNGNGTKCLLHLGI